MSPPEGRWKNITTRSSAPSGSANAPAEPTGTGASAPVVEGSLEGSMSSIRLEMHEALKLLIETTNTTKDNVASLTENLENFRNQVNGKFTALDRKVDALSGRYSLLFYANILHYLTGCF